jgi:hypothetical protein
MGLFQKLFGGEESLETIIAEARKEIDGNPTGHLPISYRVKLNKLIADETTTLKIWLECVKRADAEGDEIIVGMTHKVTEFLYEGRGDKKYFEEFADDNRNHFVQYDNAYGFAGLTACWCAYGVAYGTEVEDYNGKDDDFDFEMDDWTPDFFASIAVSGGNPFVGGGDAARRREFWKWYLDTIQTLVASPDKPILPLKEIAKAPKSPATKTERTQTTNTESITATLHSIATKAIEVAGIEDSSGQWNKIEIDYFSFRGHGSIMYLQGHDGTKNRIDNLEYIDLVFSSINKPFSEIRKEMYAQNPREGAWFTCRMTIAPDKTFDISFKYDDQDDMSAAPGTIAKNIDNLSYEFKTYPRSKEFTPEWLQKVVKRTKLTYLN